MKILAIGVVLLCWAQVCAPDRPALRIPAEGKDWIRKEVSAIILMTLEFVKDMNMKMRDVKRVERYYYGTIDFGAGRLFTAIGLKFDHMVALYKNYSNVAYLLEVERNDVTLRSEVVGMLQFMLGDYCEFLSLIDVFKERYVNWKASSARWLIHDTIEKFLLSRDVYPWNWENLLCTSFALKQYKRDTQIVNSILVIENLNVTTHGEDEWR